MTTKARDLLNIGATCDKRHEEFIIYKKIRKSTHDKNAEIMREFSQDNLRLSEQNTQQAREIAELKTNHAITKVTTEQFTTLVTKMDKLINNLRADMNEIKLSMAKSAGGESMLKWVAKLIASLIGLTLTVFSIKDFL